MKVSVIIPVFNEERSVGRVLEEILALDLPPFEFEIIVSDDGSADDSAEVAAGFTSSSRRVRVVKSRSNSGKGAAVRRALPLATGEVVIIQDADGEYSPSDYPKLLRPISEEAAGVVFGSRFLGRAWPCGMLPQNWIANRIFTGAANLLFGASITDEGTGYKVFRREVLENLALEANGFEFCAEVTGKLLRDRIRIVEVPISYRAREERRRSGAPGIVDGLAVLRTLVKYRLKRAPQPPSALSEG